jgi:hypothetical protein
MERGYDVIIMAGQSNAVGFGWGETDTPFTENPDIIEISDTYKMQFVRDGNGNSKLDLVFPPRENQLYFGTAREMEAYDRKNASLANSFAEEYVNAGLLKSGRKLLIVKTSIGGTGFTKKYWTEGGICRTRMFYMVDEALKLSDDMKIVAFLWHQGEHDAFERPDRTPEERKSFYKAELKNLLTDVRRHYAGHSFPIIAGEFVREWMAENEAACDAVLSATKEVFSEIGNAALVSSEGLLSNGKKNGTGDNLHFCRDALMKFGKRYFEAYEKLI